MSTRQLAVWITFLSIFAMATRISMDTDTFWHLRAGEWMFINKSILREDLFSFTRYAEAWHYPGWIVQIPMYLIHRTFGPGGLNLWTAAMVMVGFYLLWKILHGGTYLKAFLLILAATASGVYWSARPHLLTFVLSAATLFILEKYWWSGSVRDRRNLFLLPAIMLIWVNGHGGFAVGFLIWGIYWLAQELHWIRDRSFLHKLSGLFDDPLQFVKNPDFTLSLVGLLMLICVGINPSGFEMINYPYKTLAIGAVKDYLQEWQSPDFHSLSVQPFIWLIILGFASVGLSRKRIVLTDFLLFSIFMYLGLLAGRNFPLFSLAATVVISRHLAVVVPEFQEKLGIQLEFTATSGTGFKLVNLIILCIVFLGVIAKISLVFPARANEVEFRKFLPIDAVTILNQSGVNGRMFNSYNWGGYLIWSARDYPVFIDGRTDLYDDELVQEWLKIVRVDKGWEENLDSYEVKVVLTETGSNLAKSLERNSHWINFYQDPIAVIYFRQGVLQ